jgi:hypothetical protein
MTKRNEINLDLTIYIDIYFFWKKEKIIGKFIFFFFFFKINYLILKWFFEEKKIN